MTALSLDRHGKVIANNQQVCISGVSSTVAGFDRDADLLRDRIIACVNGEDPRTKALVEALELVASSGPLNNGLRDDATMDRVRAALALAKT